ncbi:DNA methyltransferase [Paenibacillus durus]|nr:DNA methyltransferase [Paenibacillus durus]
MSNSVLQLLAIQIRNSSQSRDVAVDFFGGSGFTLMTCEQLGRMPDDGA